MQLHCDLRIDRGDFRLSASLKALGTRFGLFGPSGAGKTSLIRAFAGLDPATGYLEIDGEVWLDSAHNQSLPAHRRRVGWVPQDNALLPHLDVKQNLSFSDRAETGLMNLVVESLELKPLLSRTVFRLSGGEAKRVALGRALVSQPRLLLLDEPLAGLDWRMKRQLLGILLRVQSRFETPIVFVSHDPEEIGLFCSEVWFLREGQIVAQGTAEEVFLRPESEQAALIAGIENRWSARVQSAGPEGAVLEVGELSLHVDFEGSPGDYVVAMVPASEILLSPRGSAGTSARNLWPARVRNLEHRVHGIVVHLDCDANPQGDASMRATVPLTVLITPAAASELHLRAGDIICAIFKSSAVRVYPL
jgi:molybdate transport system ATP-binding protein